MAIWEKRCPKTSPWYNSGLGVAIGTVKVWASITSSILTRAGKARSPSTSTWNIDANGVVACEHKGSYKEEMLFWSCWGSQPQRLRENVYLVQLLVEIQKVSWLWSEGLAQSPRGLYEWGSVAGQIHPRLNNTASTGIGPIWRHSCLIWFRLL